VGSVGATGTTYYGQAFIPTSDTITEAGFWLQLGTGNGQVSLNIVPDDGLGDPDETTILWTSGTINPTGSLLEYKFSGLSVSVTPGAKYHLMVTAVGIGTATGYSRVGRSATQPVTVPQNMQYSSTGADGSWTVYSSAMVITVGQAAAYSAHFAGSLALDSGNEIFFADEGQIRSVDNNHRIIFDRSNNILELMEYGDIIFSAGATAGTRTETAFIDDDGTNRYFRLNDNTGASISNFYLRWNGTDPILNFDTNDYLHYDRSVNALHLSVGATTGHVFYQDHADFSGDSEWPIRQLSNRATAGHRNHYTFLRRHNGGVPINGTNLGGIAMGGWDGSSYKFGWNGGAEISAYATQTWGAAAAGTELRFSTTDNSTTGLDLRMTIGQNGGIGIGQGAPATPSEYLVAINGGLSVNNYIAFASDASTNHDFISYSDSDTVGMGTPGSFGFFADASRSATHTSANAGVGAQGFLANGGSSFFRVPSESYRVAVSPNQFCLSAPHGAGTADGYALQGTYRFVRPDYRTLPMIVPLTGLKVGHTLVSIDTYHYRWQTMVVTYILRGRHVNSSSTTTFTSWSGVSGTGWEPLTSPTFNHVVGDGWTYFIEVDHTSTVAGTVVFMQGGYEINMTGTTLALGTSN
jgi:hypothetical protein